MQNPQKEIVDTLAPMCARSAAAHTGLMRPAEATAAEHEPAIASRLAADRIPLAKQLRHGPAQPVPPTWLEKILVAINPNPM